MKTTKRSKAIVSIVLVLMMLVSVLTIGFVSVNAAGGLTLTYNFKYKNAGYAEGRIELKAATTADQGTYYLYWANDTKALDGYAPISTVALNTTVKYVELGEFIAIPADATKVIAVKSTSSKTVANASAVYNIPAEKQFADKSSEKEYVFQTLSDIHFHNTGYYTYAQPHFAAALEAAQKRGAAFVSTCGDNTNHGSSTEWKDYLQTIASSSFTGYIYEVNGNHEAYNSSSVTGSDHKKLLDDYRIATGLDAKTGKVRSELYYEMTASNGDHHIYMAMEYINHGMSPAISDSFSKAQIDWLQGLLNKYKNDGHKIFIYQHSPFAKYGAGDNKITPYYGAAMTIDKNLYPQTYRFKELLEANKDVIWFSGHTHLDFKYNYNIDNENGTTAYTVHVPSCASTTQIVNNAMERPQDANSSQGYFVDVYDKYVVLNGTDLVKNEILPLYTYLIDYTGEALVENDMPDKPVINYGTADVTVDVKAVSASPASVKISLFGADDNSTQAVTMTKNSDGTYKATVSKKFTQMQFVINNGASDTTSGIYDVNNCKVVIGGIKLTVNLADIKDKNNASCTGWAVVNAYAWNSSTNQNIGTWPGVAMTKNADGTYSILVPESVNPNMIIFNNGSSQTADLTLEDKYVEGVFPGSYTIIDVENPSETETTAPTETESTTPSETESTAPTETESTAPSETEKPVEYLYGDADMNGLVNIKDATTIQKFAADMITLDDVAFVQANVTGDKAVNVRDCTAIQKFVAGLLDEFAVVKKAAPAEVGASDSEFTTLVTNVKNTLSKEGYYASYDAYADLKNACATYGAKNTDAGYKAINNALTAYNTMKKNNPSHTSGTFGDNTGGNSGGSLPAGSTTNATSIDGSKTGTYAIRGSFNNWGNSGLEFMVDKGDGSYSISYQLTKGTYEFKFYDDSKAEWYGNTGTMDAGESGWTFTSGTGNCKLNAAEDGIYVFTYKLDTASNKVKISLSMK